MGTPFTWFNGARQLQDDIHRPSARQFDAKLNDSVCSTLILIINQK